MPISLATLPHRLHRWLGIDRRRTARDQAVTLDRHRIFILPTRHGLVFAAITFLMLLGAANYNNSVAFMLTFLLMGMGLVGLLQTYRNLAGVNLRPGRCVPVFCGERARYELLLENDGRGVRRAVTLRIAGESMEWLDLAPGATRAEVGAMALRRGLRPLGRLDVATCYPLGLFRAFAYVNFDQACVVYPRPAEEFAPTEPHPSPDSAGRAGQRPGNDDFIGHRDYARGDSPRRIDWKAAARADRLLSKTFGEEEHVQWWLDWDDHEGLDAETRLRRLCRRVLDAEAAGSAYGLRLPGQVLEPSRGEAHRLRCLRALALHGTGP